MKPLYGPSSDDIIPGQRKTDRCYPRFRPPSYVEARAPAMPGSRQPETRAWRHYGFSSAAIRPFVPANHAATPANGMAQATASVSWPAVAPPLRAKRA